jgi:hypothetical protein
MWTPPTCHSAGNVNYRQRSSDVGVGLLGVSVGINK